MRGSFVLPAGRRARAASLLAAGLASFVLSGASAARADERIVSIGGAVTEIIYALGRDASIAAVDTTSLYPVDALKTKPNVGYMRALSAEGVLSIKPSLILASEGAGPPAALTSLQGSGVRLVKIPEEASPDGVSRKIVAVGEIIGSGAAAQKLADEVDARFRELAALRKLVEKPRRRVLFVLSSSGGRTVVGGKNTSANAIIALAGATNAAASIDGFKPMSDESIVAAAPDVVLTMRRDNASGQHILLAPSFAATPAGKARAIVEMDGNYLLGFGPRAPDAARDLMASLYPELKLPPLAKFEKAGSGESR